MSQTPVMVYILYKKTCPSRSNQQFFSMVIHSFLNIVSDRFIPTLSFGRGRTYFLCYGVVPFVRSFFFALTLVQACSKVFDIFHSNSSVVRLLMYPANSIRSDRLRRRTWCYGDVANDHIFGVNKQLLCCPMVTYGFNVGARGVCWIHSSFY